MAKKSQNNGYRPLFQKIDKHLIGIDDHSRKLERNMYGLKQKHPHRYLRLLLVLCCMFSYAAAVFWLNVDHSKSVDNISFSSNSRFWSFILSVSFLSTVFITYLPIIKRYPASSETIDSITFFLSKNKDLVPHLNIDPYFEFEYMTYPEAKQLIKRLNRLRFKRIFRGNL